MRKDNDPSYGHNRTQSSLPLLPYADSSPTVSSFPLPRPMSLSRGKARASFLDVNTNRRRTFFVTCIFLSVISLATLALVRYSPGQRFVASDLNNTTLNPSPTSSLDDQAQDFNASHPTNPQVEQLIHDDDDVPLSPPPPPPPPVEEVEVLPSYSPWLNGPPTAHFRDNLRNDTKYITSWISAGWNNDVMTYMNLLYLGKITERVPIVGRFTPSHILAEGVAPPILFGEVFDVPRFIEESGIPMVEWEEVKDREVGVVDDVGCWNVWESVQFNEHSPRYSALTDWLGLEISWTKSPDWIKRVPNYEHSKCSTFWDLARLTYPNDHDVKPGPPVPSLRNKVVLPPDDHMACFDYLFFACTSVTTTDEWEYEYAPNWRFVGQYLYWAPKIEAIANTYVKRAFGLDVDDPLPPYIAIHVRHGDFKNWCWEAEDPKDCFAPLIVIHRRVREVQAELKERLGIDIPMNRVIMTSDEKDPEWWLDVEALQWVRIDHVEMQTTEQYGLWYPVVLDAAIQSLGYGFVGTDRSTFSVLSKRRVQDWRDGATRMVRWGKKDADAH